MCGQGQNKPDRLATTNQLGASYFFFLTRKIYRKKKKATKRRRRRRRKKRFCLYVEERKVRCACIYVKATEDRERVEECAGTHPEGTCKLHSTTGAEVLPTFSSSSSSHLLKRRSKEEDMPSSYSTCNMRWNISFFLSLSLSPPPFTLIRSPPFFFEKDEPQRVSSFQVNKNVHFYF